MKNLHTLFSVAISVGILSGCATTTVKKNPGEHDRGVRYYRPKPYLLVQPTTGKSDEFVTLTLDYLPDFSEEYSIHVKAGIGVNKTKITLENGWKLTQLDMDIDSKFNENVKAFGDLLKNAGEFTKAVKTEGTAPRMVVKSNNVPLGYYESVIDRGPDGKKRLYGWRYVGFMPYANCPVSAGGAECVDCHSEPIYGLIVREGVMTFVQLGKIEPQKDLQKISADPVNDDDLKATLAFISDNKDNLTKLALDGARQGNVPMPQVANIEVGQLPKLVFTISYQKGATLSANANEKTVTALNNLLRTSVFAAGYRAQVSLVERKQ